MDNNDRTTSERNEIKETLQRAKLFFAIGAILTIAAPICFILCCGHSYTTTGVIGDTIGGITAPIVNILGAVLVYFALKAQTQANLMVQRQIDEQNAKERLEHESAEISTLYETLKSSIDGFRYHSLEPENFGNGEYLIGNEAIYKLFNDFYCNYHEDEEAMACNPKLTEIISILEICEAVLAKLSISKIPNREVMRTLTIHQFEYRIMPRLNSDLDRLKPYPCQGCGKDHGLPPKIVSLIEKIKAHSK